MPNPTELCFWRFRKGPTRELRFTRGVHNGHPFASICEWCRPGGKDDTWKPRGEKQVTFRPDPQNGVEIAYAILKLAGHAAGVAALAPFRPTESGSVEET